MALTESAQRYAHRFAKGTLGIVVAHLAKYDFFFTMDLSLFTSDTDVGFWRSNMANNNQNERQEGGNNNNNQRQEGGQNQRQEGQGQNQREEGGQNQQKQNENRR